MGEVAARREQGVTRLLLPTERSDMTLSWHPEVDGFALSLWHDDACAASATLTPPDAAALAGFLVTQLGRRTVWGPRLVVSEPPPPRPRSRAVTAVEGQAVRLAARFTAMARRRRT
jgi:hypothetical protein